MDRELVMRPTASAKPLSLGGRPVRPPLLLAPMADIGAAPFRRLVRSFGGCGLLYSEMLNSRRVPVEPDGSPFLEGLEKEPDLVLQLVGDEAEALAGSLKRLENFRPFGYDLNLGCSRQTMTCWGWGSALLTRPQRVAQIICALRRITERPLTVKLRVLDKGQRQEWFDLLHLLESEGVDGVIVHPRTPDQTYARPARWELIAEAKARLKIPVIGNGDVRTPADALAMLAQTGCDGVMIGRGAAVRPYIFARIAAALAGEPEPAVPRPEQVMDRMLAELGPRLESPKGARELKTFCRYFAESLPVPHWFWGPLQSARTGQEIKAKIEKYFEKH